MTIGSVNNSITQMKLVQDVKPKQADIDLNSVNNVTHSESKYVVLSDEGRALLTALSEIDQAAQLVKDDAEGVGENITSFTHGILGMEHPDEVEEQTDSSYSAGQYLKGALAVGGLILAIV